jgi:hypothetical protein
LAAEVALRMNWEMRDQPERLPSIARKPRTYIAKRTCDGHGFLIVERIKIERHMMQRMSTTLFAALLVCSALFFPSAVAQDPVPDPMFSPEVAQEPGAVKTMLAAGAYLNSPEFAQSLIAAPMVANDSDLVNETNCTILVWRDASSLDPPGTNNYPTLPPGTNTQTDPAWAGDSVDYIRIACVWYKLYGKSNPLASEPFYRITETPCGSRNFAVEARHWDTYGNAVWSAVSPHPCGQPKPWYLGGGTYWCPDPPPGETSCDPLTDPECEDCEGGDPDPPGGGELP